MATKKKVVKEEEGVVMEELVEAIEALNEALSDEDQIEIYEGKGKNKKERDFDELKDEFFTGLESLTDDEIPEVAKDVRDKLQEGEEGSTDTKDEGSNDDGEVTEEELVEAIDALNETDLASEQVETHEGKGKNKTLRDFDTLVSEFMTAAESVPEKKENDLPDIVSDTYNKLAEIIKAKEVASKKSKKEEKEMKDKDKNKGKANGNGKTKVVDKDKKKDPDKVARGKALAAARKEKGGEGNIPLMKRLLKEKKTDKEILKIFQKKYEGKDLAFVEKRVSIYKNLAQKK